MVLLTIIQAYTRYIKLFQENLLNDLTKLLLFFFWIPRFFSVSPFRALVHQVAVVQLEAMVVAVEFLELQWKIGSRPSIANLKSFIKGNLNGQFLIVSCASLSGWLLPKSSCLLIDLSLDVSGMFPQYFLLPVFRRLPFFPVFFSLIQMCLYYRPMIENGKNPQKYIRYTPEDLERMLSEFFEGKTWNEKSGK